jgi:hypothetical protein
VNSAEKDFIEFCERPEIANNYVNTLESGHDTSRNHLLNELIEKHSVPHTVGTWPVSFTMIESAFAAIQGETRHERMHLKNLQTAGVVDVNPISLPDVTMDVDNEENKEDILVESTNVISSVDDSQSRNVPLVVPNPLQWFKSSRLIPNHLLSYGLDKSTTTYSYKIDNFQPLCRYDLHGVCNDVECTGQHFKNIVLSPLEVLHDIASYGGNCQLLNASMVEQAKQLQLPKDVKTLSQMIESIAQSIYNTAGGDISKVR